ncbi:hypothetical protein AAG906_010894 [Vitis piasezkii]
MAAACEITATEFLWGTRRQNLLLQRNSHAQKSRLLWGTFHVRKPKLGLSNRGTSLRCRAQAKPRAVVSGGVTSPLDEKSNIVQKPTAEGGLSGQKLLVLKWLLQETYEPENLGTESFLDQERRDGINTVIIEVGPRLSFTTAWSANAVSICRACGLTEVTRMERSRRYLLYVKAGSALQDHQINEFAAMVHDRMTECVYTQKLTSFETSVVPEEVRYVPVMERGRKALEDINEEMGLAFDEQDLQYYTRLFREDIKRDPTTVELFDIAQSNSEHSRHWFFTGKIVIDGQPMSRSLMQIVKSTLQANPNNSVIGFKDNSSAIKGFLVKQLRPVQPGLTCPLDTSIRDLDILFTAETHNFPCAVAPYPGAETGAGGRIRDTHATGRGSFVVAATAGYCVGNLNIEGSYAPWEDPSFTYPSNLASPLQILIDASNGASDYGNKFGEPLIQGYTRTFGMRLPSGERREWLKPIMFSAGIGQIDHIHITKGEPDIGMLVVKIGGPAYRIGMGGGAASSMVSGQNDAELDFNAVQRGDAEMAQKLYRVVRACIEMREDNPIISIHDQGAGGNCNVVKEIIYPKGAQIDIRSIVVGDHTMSVLEIWGAEYQEQDAILVKPESRSLLQSICERERVSMAVIGTINGEGRIVLVDSKAIQRFHSSGLPPPPPAVDLELEKRVLRLPSVCSKRFLTTKVDRCVTGLVAQQQTVGPLQITLSDVAVISQTYTDLTGGACAIGEQPIKGLLDPKAMARLAVGEALTNLVWAKVTALSDVKSSANWMYAAKLEGEGAAMYDAAMALSEAMIELGIAIDGGKDSLSMAAHASGEVVKAPGNLVISVYVTCPDITKTVTPDLKLEDEGILLHIDLSKGKRRLGGSALAQVFDQVGDESPDLDDVPYLKRAFEGVQELLADGLISAGHDISDGGLIVCVLEMAFAGNCGIALDLTSHGNSLFETLFAEELGLVLEVSRTNLDMIMGKLHGVGVSAEIIGQVTATPMIELKVDDVTHLNEDTSYLRDMWEETSFQLEKFQRLASCVDLEKEGLKSRHEPSWKLSFTPAITDKKYMTAISKPKVAVIREEGSNGDREMSAAFYAAGGFSYADVLDSAKGWSASIRFNQPLLNQFQEFYNREDTFSLGVCNGCQLMALLGWVPGPQVGGVFGNGGDPSQPRFIHNESGRFECRFTSVTIKDSPAIMFKGMEGSTLGVWAAHGEGRAYFPDGSVLDSMIDSNLAPIRYCDDDGKPTEVYPFNLNGSPLGVAAICSPNGRHLAMMPHPERCFLMWQFPWYPKQWNVDKAGPSPWLRISLIAGEVRSFVVSEKASRAFGGARLLLAGLNKYWWCCVCLILCYSESLSSTIAMKKGDACNSSKICKEQSIQSYMGRQGGSSRIGNNIEPMRGGRCWFAVELKSFQFSVEAMGVEACWREERVGRFVKCWEDEEGSLGWKGVQMRRVGSSYVPPLWLRSYVLLVLVPLLKPRLVPALLVTRLLRVVEARWRMRKGHLLMLLKQGEEGVKFDFRIGHVKELEGASLEFEGGSEYYIGRHNSFFIALMGHGLSKVRWERLTWVVTVGCGFLMFCSTTVVGSATVGVGSVWVLRVRLCSLKGVACHVQVVKSGQRGCELGPRLGCALMEKGGGGPSLNVEKGQPSGIVLELVGLTQVSDCGSLREVRAFGESVFVKEWMADKEVFGGMMIVEAKDLCLMACHVLVVAGMGHDALVGPIGKEGEVAFDSLGGVGRQVGGGRGKGFRFMDDELPSEFLPQLGFIEVYGPMLKKEREGFWVELGAIRGLWSNPWYRPSVSELSFESARPNGFSITFWQFLWEFRGGAEDLRDCKPISLVGGLCKWLAKGKQILDAVLVANEVIDSILKSNDCVILSKLDIEKVYDHGDLSFLLSIMDEMGFGEKWIGWIKWCISTTSFSVLVNGTPSDKVEDLAAELGCKVGSLPSSYLGMPLGATFKSVAVWDGGWSDKGLSRFKGIFCGEVELLSGNLILPFNDWEVDEVESSLLCLHGKRTKSGKFSVKSLYKALESGFLDPFPMKIIWNSWVQPKVGFFVREATGWSLVNRCYLCQMHEESIDHILFHCLKTRALWEMFFTLFRVSCVLPSSVKSTFLGWNESFVGKK